MINIPLLIFLVLAFFGMVIVMTKHGEPHPDYNAYTSYFATLLEFILVIWAVAWGSFI